jgi:hypothetical protein
MLRDFIQRQRGVREGAAGPHLRGHLDGLHDLLRSRTLP